MFSLLRHAYAGAAFAPAELLASGQNVTDTLKGVDDFSSHTLATGVISDELLAKEKEKAKQGYCETALWNCNDLWGP
jgi:hypothetical protein